MAFDSYRDFVNQLDKAGELKRITQPVATELEITELADREMKSASGGKALLQYVASNDADLRVRREAMEALQERRR